MNRDTVLSSNFSAVDKNNVWIFRENVKINFHQVASWKRSTILWRQLNKSSKSILSLSLSLVLTHSLSFI